MSSFTREFFTGYTRAPGQTRLGYTRPGTVNRPSALRRTSTKRVTFKSPSPERTTRRKSKERTPRSPRSKIIKHISKGFKRMSPSRFQNKYARDVGEFVQAVSPALLGALTVYLYYSDIFKRASEEV